MHEEWRLLYRHLIGNATVEVMAAASFDGVGVIARWTSHLNPDGTVFWEVEAVDTEGDDGMQRVTDFSEGEPVPPTPPVYLVS
jgi:hypothetical protein